MMWENVTPFQMDKLWSQVVHYYVDKKKMSKERKKEIENDSKNFLIQIKRI